MNTISVIIPTFNRPAQLKCCLAALSRLHYPKNQFEVVIVDDGGSADINGIIEIFQDSLQTRMVKQENTGPASARNNGVAHATGKFIAFTDDDCAPEENWLGLLSVSLEQDPSRMYGGRTINALEANVYSQASQTLIDHLYGYYNAVPDQARFFTSNNMAMARNMFTKVGGFSEKFYRASAEDRELCDRWLQLGYRMSYVPEARVRHNHELDLGSFWMQHFTYGSGAWRFLQIKRLRGNGKLHFEPPTFYLNLITCAWKQKLHRPMILSLLMVLSQIANATGFVGAKLRVMMTRSAGAGQATS